ncbi:MAG: adenylate/guanylate cyclase domain-containing protein, partial [Alphaproteobacteria bacterium]
MEFPSAVDAVRCAMAMQQGMAARNADVSPENRIEFRIGINVGDVISQGGDLLGDGVNIAARLEGLSEPGGIALSANAHEYIEGKVESDFTDDGEHEVKNINRPVRVWRWQPSGKSQPSPPADNTKTPALSDKPSIAVLPFDNMSGDPEQEYFADGLTEDLITDISKLSGLLVIGRNSSFVYKGKSVDQRQVGRDLGFITCW